MTREPQEFLPLARRQGMVIKDVDNEVLVYDLERDEAHCLNLSAAAIWRRCDGTTTVSMLARSLQTEMGAPVDERLVWLGLETLRRSHLLEDDTVWPDQLIAKRMSRREAVRRIGIGAAIAVPLVFSISAPTPVQAASCSASCKPCNTGSDCCSGVCLSNNPGCSGSTRKCT